MKIDSHQHFRKQDATDYGWIDNQMKILKRHWLADDLEPWLNSFGVV